MPKYPDVSEVLKAKEARRRRLAKLPFEAKVVIVRRLQQLRAASGVGVKVARSGAADERKGEGRG